MRANGQAEPRDPVQIFNNGPYGNRIDIVILGDGYRATEMGKSASNANKFLAALFADAPFKQRLFSAHLIDPAVKTVSVTWRLGGKLISTASRVIVKEAALGGKPKRLDLVIRDKTALVRTDPTNLLIDKASWTVRPGL
jgi:hypothetical protein